MLPRLYDFSYDHTYYENNGYGHLTEVMKCEVKEVLNGEYTLDLEVHPSDRLASQIDAEKCIMVDPNPTDNPQLFKIITVNIDWDKISIKGEHIKNAFFNDMYVPSAVTGESQEYSVTGTPEEIFANLLSSSAWIVLHAFEFRFITDITSSKTIKFNLGANLTFGNIFTDSENGMVTKFNADFKYDNWKVYFLNHRGKEHPYNVVRYGSNLSSFTQTMSSEKEYSHILPYANVAVNDDYTGNITSVTLFGLRQVAGTPGTYEPIPTGSTSNYYRILPVDFSSKFNDPKGYVNPNPAAGDSGYQAVKEKLAQYGETYAAFHTGIRSAAVTIKVDYEEALDDFEKAQLGDVVRVIYDPTGYKKNHRITEAVYDCLNERWKSLTIGERNYSLYTFLKDLRRR